jgi:hypothetical protein
MRGLKSKSLEELFAGRHFNRGFIILCVRWYLRYKLSLRDLVEMMRERGLQLAHTTILRWVRRYAQSSSNAGTVSEEALVDRGESTKPISRSVGDGCTCIEQWTKAGTRWTSG